MPNKIICPDCAHEFVLRYVVPESARRYNGLSICRMRKHNIRYRRETITGRPEIITEVCPGSYRIFSEDGILIKISETLEDYSSKKQDLEVPQLTYEQLNFIEELQKINQ